MTEIKDQLMTPTEVVKLAKRLRGKGPTVFSAHVGFDMPTADGTYYPYRTSISDLTLNQLTRMCKDMQRFADLKQAKGASVPAVKVSVMPAEPAPQGMRPLSTFLWIG